MGSKENGEIIIKYNELIAKFMGRIKTKYDGNYWWSDEGGNDLYQWQDFQLQYHAIWDWIMPVAQKIRVFFYKEQSDNPSSEMVVLYKNIQNSLLIMDIYLLWKAIVNFIKWQNKITNYDT